MPVLVVVGQVFDYSQRQRLGEYQANLARVLPIPSRPAAQVILEVGEVVDDVRDILQVASLRPPLKSCMMETARSSRSTLAGSLLMSNSWAASMDA